LLWSALFYDRPRLVRDLGKVGTGISPHHLIRDYRDVDKQEGGQRSLWPDEQLLQQALVYFGDQGHRQPTQRTDWPDWGRTPDWPGGRLPPLEDGATSVTPAHAARLPPLPPDVNLFPFASIQKAVRLFDQGDSLNAVAGNTVFSPHDAARVRWLWQRDYLSLSLSDVLLIDWRIGRVGKRYALRV
jgi:hypothetical protein